MAKDRFDSDVDTGANSINQVLLDATGPLTLKEILSEVDRRSLPSTSAPREHLSRLEGKNLSRPRQYARQIDGTPSRWIRCELAEPTVWKIAPGNRAEDWPLFRSLNCIGIGWLEDLDLRQFKTISAIESALVDRYGENVPGFGSGAAQMIYDFVFTMDGGDIIFANDGYNRCVGIGVVRSRYLPPDAAKNPLRLDETTHRHHARLIDWISDSPVEISGGRLFEQKTIAKMNAANVNRTRRAYLQSCPSDARLAKELDQLFGRLRLPKSAQSSDSEPPKRVPTTTYRILRATALALRVKQTHQFRCQICGDRIESPNGEWYAEAHHIQPLGSPHDGPDIVDNILCLCPNHHAMCDFGFIELSAVSLRVEPEHSVSEVFINYHNQKIWLENSGVL